MNNIIVENEIVMKPIQEIKPYIRNPRKNDKTVELLCKVIPKVGFNVPLVIDEKGIIVKGHARFTAAIRLGMTELPCIVTHADEEAIKADRITDNKISEFSEWLNEELLHEVDMINLDIDFTELGLPSISLDDMPTAENFFEDFDSNASEGVEATEISEEDRKRLYQEFLEQQAKESATEVEITTEKEVQKAAERQASIGEVKTKYYKCICEKCGHIMFVREGDLVEH